MDLEKRSVTAKRNGHCKCTSSGASKYYDCLNDTGFLPELIVKRTEKGVQGEGPGILRSLHASYLLGTVEITAEEE